MNNIKNKNFNLKKFVRNVVLLTSLSLPAITPTKTNATMGTPVKMPTFRRVYSKLVTDNVTGYSVSKVYLVKPLTVDLNALPPKRDPSTIPRVRVPALVQQIETDSPSSGTRPSSSPGKGNVSRLIKFFDKTS